jgi:dipeptidyl aminopeptidase/acylaminoacyl peptidase
MSDTESGQSLASWLMGLRSWDAGRAVASVPATVPYGDHPDQVADLWLPPEDALPEEGLPPLVVSIHGGYFMAPYRRDLHMPIVHELVLRGFAVWNVEYRRTGTGGGLAETTADVWAAVDALPPTAGQVAVFGHSAGGYLAETLATHPRVDLVVPLAGALDLAGVVRAGWDGGAVAEWLGADLDEDPARYAAADLLHRLPTGTPRVLIHGTADTTVGVEQSRAFAEAAITAGDPTDLLELEGEGHYAFLDPRQPAFETLCTVLERWRHQPRPSDG